MSTQLSDVLIVGGGTAGLSAALTLVRQNHTVILFDSQEYRTDVSFFLHAITSWDHKTPSEYYATARRELEKYKAFKLINSEVTELRKIDGSSGIFEALTKARETYQGKKVILANGVAEIYPEVEGYASCWGKGIFHNLFCQPYKSDPKNPSAGVLAIQMLAMPRFALHMAHLAAQLADSVIIYTDGNEPLAQELSKIIQGDVWKKYKIDARKIARLALNSSTDTAMDIFFEEGAVITHSFLGHSPFTQPKGPFVKQLGLELSQTGEYKTTDPFFQTTVKGVYGAGDVITMFKVAPNAIASGAQTGAGVAVAIQEQELGLKPIFS